MQFINLEPADGLHPTAQKTLEYFTNSLFLGGTEGHGQFLLRAPQAIITYVLLYFNNGHVSSQDAAYGRATISTCRA